MTLRYAATAAVLLVAAAARADAVPCAGDGLPQSALEMSAFASGAAMAFGDLSYARGDELPAPGLTLLAGRLGMCGVLQSPLGGWLYNVSYEPWSARERSEPSVIPYGRFTAAEIGWRYFAWGTLWAGIHKVPFSRGRDEARQGMGLPSVPMIAGLLAPDRRLGLTFDAELGAARILIGGYEAPRDLVPVLENWVVTDRVLVEPFGPVGPEISTITDDAYWRDRPRAAIGSSGVYEFRKLGVGYTVGGDLGFKWGPVGLAAEFNYFQNVDDLRPGADPTAPITGTGLWAQAALMLLRPFLEVTARYEWVDVLGRSAPRDLRVQAVTVGATLYALHPRYSLQAAYVHKIYADGRDDGGLILVLNIGLGNRIK